MVLFISYLPELSGRNECFFHHFISYRQVETSLGKKISELAGLLVMFLNQVMSVPLASFPPIYVSIANYTFVLMRSRIFSLMMPISDFVGFIRRDVGASKVLFVIKQPFLDGASTRLSFLISL